MRQPGQTIAQSPEISHLLKPNSKAGQQNKRRQTWLFGPGSFHWINHNAQPRDLQAGWGHHWCTNLERLGPIRPKKCYSLPGGLSLWLAGSIKFCRSEIFPMVDGEGFSRALEAIMASPFLSFS
ncbi:hypothetical protein TWF106_003903 [Orbilia oligospora]|uniref:Uncharacterized protein n=1 Tax=Orbilia oligospora TaxID=2813651 RepID=A0A6G1ME74_ORBOL|nr:hypothetical protein TWF788_000069 [Orbilia oligospora]KAF3217338.1 hypothetical protein TWF679_002350 [Orbilia oligospora]KAF3224438.1 hypothetical protein TWF106_003903 [Orbilia oligospora]KAF3231839.1 hypothetical protein TWF191_003818 [Orbilia oligospora]KAF3255778.1 hypothetical protein TWF192_002218 [Orbilia oligospora]